MPRKEPQILRVHGLAMDTFLITEAMFRENDGVIDEREMDVLNRLRRLMRKLEGLNLARLLSHSIADHGVDLDNADQMAALSVLTSPHNVRQMHEYRRDFGGPEAA